MQHAAARDRRQQATRRMGHASGGEAARARAASDEHARPMQWGALRRDPPGPLPEVDHAMATGVTLGGVALLGSAAFTRNQVSDRLAGVGRLRRYGVKVGEVVTVGAELSVSLRAQFECASSTVPTPPHSHNTPR